MKKILTTLAIFFSLTTFGQTTKEYFKSGISKQDQQDFKGAIKDFNLAIKIDTEFQDAYFNRATCELKLKDYNAAIKDFTKVLKLDPTFPKAYYNKATIYVIQKKYNKALYDLDKTIELDITIPNALILRGQIRYETGNKKGAIDDFNTAKQIGDRQADKYLAKYVLTGSNYKNM